MLASTDAELRELDNSAMPPVPNAFKRPKFGRPPSSADTAAATPSTGTAMNFGLGPLTARASGADGAAGTCTAGGLCPGKTACTVQSPGIIHPCQWSLAGIMCPAGLQPDPCRRKPDPCTPNECSTSTHHLCAATIFGGGPPTAAHGTWCYSCASQDVVCSRALTELNVPLYNGSASIAEANPHSGRQHQQINEHAPTAAGTSARPAFRPDIGAVDLDRLSQANCLIMSAAEGTAARVQALLVHIFSSCFGTEDAASPITITETNAVDAKAFIAISQRILEEQCVSSGLSILRTAARSESVRIL